MRKGTRSCTACRRRKVRCSYPSNQASKCVHCVRRGSTCVPQGEDIDVDIEVPAGAQTCGLAEERKTSEGEEAFFKALKGLRQSIAGLSARELEGRDTGRSELLENDCAPIIRLFNHELIGGAQQSTPNTTHPTPSKQHLTALKDLTHALPPDSELTRIFHHRTDWWPAWRESSGLLWGDTDDTTLQSFATRTIRTAHPSLLATLLLCLAFSTGEHARYIPVVERHFLNDEAGFRSLQPRRAWTVYRRANTLLQLHGIHRRHRENAMLDSLFWQLFAADRWASLLIGLPYSVPEALCDLYIPSPGVDGITAVEYHCRHLAILTGRVIDCLQSLQGPSLSSAVSVEERIDEVTGHLPPGYVDLSQMTICPDYKEKHTRAFRLANIHHLKAFLYLPFFLSSPGQGHEHGHDRQSYGRAVCAHSARTLLEAYLVLYESDPDATSIDNAFKFSSLTALTAAVIVFLDLIGERHTSQNQNHNKNQRNGHEYDEALINRTIMALRGCAGDVPGSLCGQCCTALETLLDSSRAVGRERGRRERGRRERKEVRRIVVPYCGVVSIERRKDGRGAAGTHGGNEIAVPSEDVGFNGNGLDLALDDLLWAYQGPWMGNDMGFLPDEGTSYATFDLTNDFWQPQ